MESDRAAQRLAAVTVLNDHPFANAPGPLRSINLARFAALPDELADDDVIGRRGIHVVSGLALARELARCAGPLGLDPGSATIVRDFSALLASPETASARRRDARAVASRFGIHVGSLLLLLARGESANRAARPEWGDAQWAFWAQVRHVVIGGGLLAGPIGDVAVPAAEDVLDRYGVAITIQRSSLADGIVLVGLARRAPAAAASRAVVDFGQSAVKLGVADYRAGRLQAVRILPARPNVCGSLIGLSTDRVEIERQWMTMIDLVDTVAREAVRTKCTPDAAWATGPGARVATTDEDIAVGSPAAPDQDIVDVAISLACYLRGSEPDPYEAQSCYGRLQLLGPNLTDMAGRALSDRLGREVRVGFVHDGDAAALAIEPDARTVVLTIGTAMGIGFPLARDERTPLAPGFSLR